MKTPITIRKNELSEIVDEIHDVLSEKCNNIYQMNESLVTICKVEGETKIIKYDRHSLMKRIAKEFDFFKLSKDEKFLIPTDFKSLYADILLSQNGQWKFKHLQGISNVPLLAQNGRLCINNGYDPIAKIFFEIPTDYLLMDQGSFNKEEAIKAWDNLVFPIKDFPFKSPADLSVYISIILSHFVTVFVKNFPIFGLTANSPGTGKSKLTDIFSVISKGLLSDPMGWSDRDEESEKRLISKFIKGDKTIIIDNIERPFRSEVLCTYATQETYSCRPLGKSQIIRVDASGLIICTGNNLIFQGDLIRRTLMCTLHTELERPELREFNVSPEVFCMENRVKLVISALVILKSFIDAGAPKQKISGFGSFEAWSSLVRGAIVWIGKDDPNLVVEKIRSDDPELQLLENLVTSWISFFGDKPLKVSQLFVESIEIPKGDRLN